jgi:predicted GTPase
MCANHLQQIIDTLTGQKTRAGTSLKSVTDEVSAHRVMNHPKYGSKLVFVDTPGFDDTNKSDKQILEMISQWMTKTYVCVLFMRSILNLSSLLGTNDV